MRSTQKRFGVFAGFSILLVLLAINTAILRHQLAVQVSHQQWFSHSKRVVQELKDTESLVKDAETGQRGYLYTGQREYLVPYNRASGEMESHLQYLASLVRDSPPQESRVADLSALIRQKMAELAQTVSLYQSDNTAEARAITMSGTGYVIMEKIRSLAGQIEQEESSLSEKRRAAYEESIRLTVACIYTASALAALGLILLALFILRELKWRERDAASIRQSEAWFRATLSSIGDGVIVTDVQGAVSFLNPIAERLTGTSMAEARGKPIQEVFPIFSEVSKLTAENPVEQVLTQGVVAGLTNHTVLRHKDGHFLPIDDSAAPIRDDSGKLIGAVLVFHDASRERSFQDVLRRTEKLAAAARLAATVSHEINNPLEAVGNLIFLAKTNIGSPAETIEHLELAEQELARVSHITRQTLGFYRESTRPTFVHIPDLVDATLRLYSNKIGLKQIKLELALQKCPAIVGLAGEIQQMVSNLVSNAIDALPLGGTLKIDASLVGLADHQSVQLQVEDNGSGIAQEHLGRIFEPFFTTKKDVGTGLGLWVCKEIAERHGGTVQARSKNDNGSTGAVFTVLLPHQEVVDANLS
jgi:PAS domain S-box-containing protein